jgi:hypothetical protein
VVDRVGGTMHVIIWDRDPEATPGGISLSEA